MKSKIKCELCKKETKELFERGLKLVCQECKIPDNTGGGVVLNVKLPLALGRGRIIEARKPSLSQNVHPES